MRIQAQVIDTGVLEVEVILVREVHYQKVGRMRIQYLEVLSLLPCHLLRVLMISVGFSRYLCHDE